MNSKYLNNNIEEDDEEIISSFYHERLTPIKSFRNNSFDSISSSNCTTCNTFSSNSKSVSTSDSTNYSILDHSCHSDCTSETFFQSVISPSFCSITMDFNINNSKNMMLSSIDSKNVKQESIRRSYSSSSSLLTTSTSLKQLRKIKSDRSEMDSYINNTAQSTCVDKLENNYFDYKNYDFTITPFNVGNSSNTTKNKSSRRSDKRSITPLTSSFGGINMD